MFDLVDEGNPCLDELWVTAEDRVWLSGGADDISVSEMLPNLAGLPAEVAAVLLSGVDPTGLSGVGKVQVLQGHARLIAAHQAALLETMMSIVDEYQQIDGVSDLDESMQATVAELRAALCLTRRAAETDVDLAWRLRDRLPNVLTALRDGMIDLRRARVLATGTGHLSEGEARRVCDKALERAAGLTTGQLRALLRRLCVQVDADQAVKRYEQAITERVVSVQPEETGTATVHASNLAPGRVAAVMDRLTRLAMSLGPDGRTIDQRRADIFLDLLEGSGDYQPRKGVVNITVDVATLAGLDNQAVELSGYGPVIADIGRQIAQTQKSTWQFTITNQHGDVVHTGITRRRPTTDMRRQVEARDVTCVFPGCRMPATACDLDHRIPIADGGTTHHNQLVALCRHDHLIRHKTGWTHQPNPDQTHTWTSPLGTKYTRPQPP